LLLGADIKKIVKETGPVLKAFLVGTIGTLLGSTIAYIMLYRYFPVGVDWKIASAITAKNIGGGLNFMVGCRLNILYYNMTSLSIFFVFVLRPFPIF